MVGLLCDFKILLTVFNQSYNCQTSHNLGRNRLPKPFLILPSLVNTIQTRLCPPSQFFSPTTLSQKLPQYIIITCSERFSMIHATLNIHFTNHIQITYLVLPTAYSWNIMCQKWEGDCGLWVLNEIIIKKYAESLKKIVGAVWELPAK